MKHINIIFSIVMLIASALTSCSGNDEPKVPKTCKRTVLVYMIATNSLGTTVDSNTGKSFDELDIEEMNNAMEAYSGGDCRLLVYRAEYGSSPKLYEIKHADGNGSTTEILKEYPNRLHASVTKARLSEVIGDITQFAPAQDYGLVLWSHADGWARSLTGTKNTTVRDFGEDAGAKMPIDSLADAIPDHTFSFIYTDVCYMGGIEVAYQLRNKTQYFIGSPTQTPAYGMPYDQNIDCFFEDNANLAKACQNTYNSYAKMSGIYRSITISLIDCSKLEELAHICKKIFSSAKIVETLDGFQHYNQTRPYFFYDFKQYIDSISSSEELKLRFNSALNEAVIYKAHTPLIFNTLAINDSKFSGLSSYIMGTSLGVNEEYYKTLDWYNDVIKH